MWVVGPVVVSAFCILFPKVCRTSHLFLIASFAPISFAIKAKENDLLPLEKNRVKLDDDSEDDEESKECQESSSSAANSSPAAAPPCVVVEEKKPQLTQEELEAKQGLSIAFKVLERKKRHKYKIYLLSQELLRLHTRIWTLWKTHSVSEHLKCPLQSIGCYSLARMQCSW
jgi:hypothetical protein